MVGLVWWTFMVTACAALLAWDIATGVQVGAYLAAVALTVSAVCFGARIKQPVDAWIRRREGR